MGKRKKKKHTVQREQRQDPKTPVLPADPIEALVAAFEQFLRALQSGYYQPPDRLLKCSEVLEMLRIGKSTWMEGVKSGRFPQPVLLSPGVRRWRLSDIQKLIRRLGKDVGQ